MSENQVETPPKNQRNLLIAAIVVVLLVIGVFVVIFALQGSEEEAAALPATTEAIEQTATITPEAETPTATITEESPEPTEEPAPTAEPTAAPTSPPQGNLPPEPQEIEFQAADGITLRGRYYPSAFDDAPVIVLMHWAGGDRNDWNEIAFWLQNRGLNGTSPNVGAAPWLDPSWFPPMPAGKSYAVFTFSFRGFEEPGSGGPAEWLLDAQAGVQAARQLPGVNPGRLVAIGASIGADGAVDGCGAQNCLGALSLSPGNYLTVLFAEAVKTMDEAGRAVRCFYSVEDAPAAEACNSASGNQYQTAQWPGNAHGMRLLEPTVDPSAMQMILDFLAFLGL